MIFCNPLIPRDTDKLKNTCGNPAAIKERNLKLWEGESEGNQRTYRFKTEG